MVPFTTPFSHGGNELVSTPFLGPEVTQQAVEVAHSGNALLCCKDVQIRFVSEEDGSFLPSLLCLHIIIAHLESRFLRIKSSS